MKNILVTYLGRFDSIPIFALEIAKALKKQNYNVYVIISSHISNLSDWRNCEFDGIYELDTYESVKDVIQKTIRFKLSEKKKIRNFFKGIEFDIEIRPMSHNWASMLSRVYPNIKKVSYCHDPLPHSGSGFIWNIIHKRFIKESDYVVVLTKSFIPIVEKEYNIPKENIIVSKHGLLGSYKEKQSKKIPEDLTFDSNKINFVMFGRIEKYKGIAVLLEAFRKLKEKYDNCTLSIIGSGNITEYLEQSVGISDVRFVNRYIKDEEVGWCFTGDNIVEVLPYIDATQSGVIPIALEYGVPIIASDTGGLREQLYGGEAGIFFKVSDSDSLYEKMTMFMDDSTLMREEKRKMASVVSNLNWDKIVYELMRTLDSKI